MHSEKARVETIRLLKQTNKTLKEIARECGVTASFVADTNHGRNDWVAEYVGEFPIRPSSTYINKAIAKQYDEGYSISQLMEEFDVDFARVKYAIVHYLKVSPKSIKT